ncbi:BolA family protein [Pararhodospirillum photometricum]|uniref:BolA-like protein n=1 Tax=Pararhodospirillum photometricum DSM 122 TaxID=1150469 RepID=H6SQF8_PARPM|nr:BolA family transcriptional regulator [Pararhodospirillum photometricum]CCG09677.1 BolA-like protein [Pararhodospirillum photometricum DSM 122]
MAMDPATIKTMLQDAFPDAEVTVEDLRGDGDHLGALVISQAFKGKTRVQQHQMVYEALKGTVGGDLHALALQTKPRD